ncbi:MAG: Mov34/MPN/PAD-1 family protein [Neptuniibacter sp.]
MDEFRENDIVWLPSHEFITLTSDMKLYPEIETGGLLIGYRVKHKNYSEWVVTHLTHAGPNATHNPTSYEPDYEYDQAQADKLFHASGGSEYYIGDWHTHPNGAPEASWLDKRSLYTNAKRSSHTEHSTLMLIVGGSHKDPLPQAFSGKFNGNIRFWNWCRSKAQLNFSC